MQALPRSLFFRPLALFSVVFIAACASSHVRADDPAELLKKGIAATPELGNWSSNNEIRTNQVRDGLSAHAGLKKAGGGYGRAANIYVSLSRCNTTALASKEHQMHEGWVKNGNEKRLLQENLGFGAKSMMYDSPKLKRDGTPISRPWIGIYALQGEWVIRATLSNRRDESFVTDASGKAILKSLCKNIVANLKPGEDHFPIIFLPGVAGTQLYANTSGSAKELWPIPHLDVDTSRMLLDPQGVPLDTKVFPKDIIRTKISGLSAIYHELGVYEDMIEQIQEIEFDDQYKYVEGENLFTWGYDWRLDNTMHLGALDRVVNQIRVKTASKKVILIAHSMGGLISRAYAVKHPTKVEAIISIGTPYAGSPKPFYGLLMGYTFGNPLVDRDVMKDLLQNAPSAYQIMPQYDFVMDTQTARMIPNREFYSQIKYKHTPRSGLPTRSNARSVNTPHLDRAKQFYASVGTAFNPTPLPPEVRHYAIIGVGIQTLKGFVLRPVTPKDTYYLDYGGSKVVLDPFFENGDGTVPLKSANIKGTTRTYFLQHKEGFFISGAHGALTNNKVAQSIVSSILRGVPYRLTGSSDPARLADIESHVDFTLRSDAHLSITDPETGKMLGYDDEGRLVETLPGTFLVMGESVHASVAGAGKPLSVQVKGIRNGKFSLDVVSTTKGRSTSYSYEEVAVRTGTVASFEVDPARATASALPQMAVKDADRSRVLTPSVTAPVAKKDTGVIPHLNARTVKFDFFESGPTAPPLAQRKFQRTFEANSTRYIWWHFQLEYPPLKADTDLRFEAIWYLPDGREMNRRSFQFQPKAGWTGSYYEGGWGSKDVNSYKAMGAYRVDLVVGGTVIASGQFTMTGGASQKKPVFAFDVWPAEHQLNVATSRLDAAIQSSTDKAQQAGYGRARDFVARAKGHYLQYRGAETGSFRGSTDPDDCPHGMMKVLRICDQKIEQVQAQWDISPRPPTMTDTAAQQISNAIAAAGNAMAQAVKEVEAHRGWGTHRGPNRIVIEAPPEFKTFSANDWPLAIRVLNAAGGNDRIVLVTWRAKAEKLSAMAFQEKAIVKEKSEHPDLHDLKSWQHWLGVSGSWFSYQYSWEGQQVKALVYQHAFGPLPWELRYVAPIASFDTEECEEIIRSLEVRP